MTARFYVGARYRGKWPIYDSQDRTKRGVLMVRECATKPEALREAERMNAGATDRPMTRTEIADHALVTARAWLAREDGYHQTREIDGVQLVRLASVIELAMCRAAGVPWGPITKGGAK